MPLSNTITNMILTLENFKKCNFSQKIMYIPRSCTAKTPDRSLNTSLNTSHQVRHFPNFKLKKRFQMKQTFSRLILQRLGIFKCNFKSKTFLG
jgi:hypothetical protein